MGMNLSLYHWSAELRDLKTGEVRAVGWGAIYRQHRATTPERYNHLTALIESDFRAEKNFPENTSFILISLPLIN
jgi:hypothetical protein